MLPTMSDRFSNKTHFTKWSRFCKKVTSHDIMSLGEAIWRIYNLKLRSLNLFLSMNLHRFYQDIGTNKGKGGKM